MATYPVSSPDYSSTSDCDIVQSIVDNGEPNGITFCLATIENITKWKGISVICGATALIACSIAAPANAASLYRLTDLGALSANPKYSSFAYSINDRGQVVGEAGSPDGNRAFLWSQETGMQNLGTLPGGSDSGARSINNLGQVLGTSMTLVPGGGTTSASFMWSSGQGMQILPMGTAGDINDNGQIAGQTNGTAALWTNGIQQNLGKLPDANYSDSVAVNNNGQVVGNSGLNNEFGFVRAFFWSNGVMQNLGTLPGDHSSNATDINNQGQVLGNSFTLSSNRAFVWSQDKGMQDLGVLPGTFMSHAYGINDNGQVAGYSTATSGSGRAFIWSSDKGLQDLNSLISPNLGWSLSVAQDINNKGQIVGWGTSPDGQQRAFLLTPDSAQEVPEPTTMAGLGLVGGAMVALRRRSQRLKNVARNH
jgi:probable HAF family extracellular repeat protein